MKRIAFVIAMLLLALIVFLWRFPANASFAFFPMSDAVKSAIKLHDVRGTLWSGSARFTANMIPATQTIAWSCAPRFSSLSIQCELTDALRGQIEVAPLAKTLTISGLETTQALQWSGVANSAFSSEMANIKLSKATLGLTQALVTANVVANRVETIAANAPLSWGEVSADCAPVDQTPGSRCTLRNRASDNRLDGQIEISANRISGNLTITPAGASAQRIAF
jgi:hypothetical protein